MSTNEFSGSRRRFTQALGLVPLACSLGAHAQSFPTKSIRLVVGYTPGGAGDATARLIAKHYSDLMNQSVVVENKPGASATLAAGAVATAPPDGYLAVNTPPDTVIAPITMRTYPVSMSSFVPVGLVVTVPTVHIVLPTSPYRTVDDLVSAATANPARSTSPPSGSAGLAHGRGAAEELAGSMSLTSPSRKRSRDGGALAGRVEFLFDTFPSARGQIEGARFGRWAYEHDTGAGRKGIPTMEELGSRGASGSRSSASLRPPNARTVLDRLERGRRR